MTSSTDLVLGHAFDDGPARPTWTFRNRAPAPAEPASADEPPDDEAPDDEPPDNEVPDNATAAVRPAVVTPALRELGEAHFWPHAHMAGDLSSPGGTRVVTRGDGVWVEDERGHRYLDTLSGMWLCNIGHGRREVADAVYKQICQLGYAPDGTVHPTTLELASRVAALAPDKDSRVFFVSGGSEAVETAMKMAKKFHRNRGEAGRYKFISRRGSYHGATHGCLSLGGGGGNNGAEYGPLPYGSVRVQGPDQYRNPFGGTGSNRDLECAREIERAILNEGPDTVAAVIGEPISAAAGVQIPHPEYWPMVREICDRYGVLLICDEVITGFGRTGRMFATEHWGIVPDITVVAKALTSGYVPIGAAIATKHVADAFIGPARTAFNHRITFGGNPVSCAAGLANLRILERENLVENAADLGGYLFGRLQELYRHDIVGQVRGGLGLICAVEIVANRAARQPFPKEAGLARRASLLMERHGLLGRAGDIFFVAPPLCVTRSEVDFLVSQLDTVIGELQADLLTGEMAA
jgi:adenosylmethionine-8-amino-7-oxononanoate aminotransferase